MTSGDGATLQSPGRLTSLDALRGFTMFWIIGGEELVHEAAQLTNWSWLHWLSGQLHHPEWNGFALYDLIFPTFLFLAGVSMPFSFEKRLSRGDTKRQLYRHVVVRGLALVFLGMVYNGLLQFDWENMRYPSVLGRIGLAYLFAALIVLNTSQRGCLVWIVATLVGYWAALKLIPVPGFGAGDLGPGHTLTDFIDRLLIPGKLYRGDRDPEGLLGTVPAIATALAGAVTGQFLKTHPARGGTKAASLLAAGLACLPVALLWNLNFPINKNLWSSSFTIYCAGWSLLLLALFYWVIDVCKLRGWAVVFVIIGSNSILIYMAQQMVDISYTTHFFFDGLLGTTGRYQPVLWWVAYLAVEVLVLAILYRKKIFLRV